MITKLVVKPLRLKGGKTVDEIYLAFDVLNYVRFVYIYLLSYF